MGLPAKAAALVDEGLKHDPSSVGIRLLAGRVAVANKQPEDARKHFNEVLRRDPKHPEALVELGRLEEASGQSASARRRFAAALKLRPKDHELLYLIARVQARGGDAKAAVASGTKAMRLAKAAGQEARATEKMMELGKQLAQGDRWARKRAEELFFEATKPKNAPAPPFLELGRIHKAQNKLPQAIWCFRQATERDPNLAEAYLELGKVLRAKPQWRKEAKASLKKYLKLKPDAPDAAKVKAMLEKMR
jgi:tetratricopeptide (TPR) repeat protein